jgi:hypothetical protein
MRRGWFVPVIEVIGVLLACCPASPALADRAREPAPETRIGYLVAQLKHDPVYVTDQVPRALPPGTDRRIKAIVGRLGVPVYVVVTLSAGLHRNDDPDAPLDLETLVPVLHDRLGKDGVYMARDPSGSGSVQEFGGARRIDAEDAYEAATSELPFGTDVPTILTRLVDIALSGQAKERARSPHPRPKSETRRELDAYDRGNHEAAVKNDTAVGIGAGIGGLVVLGLLVLRRRHRNARRFAPGKKPATKQAKKPVKKPVKKPASRKGRRR